MYRDPDFRRNLLVSVVTSVLVLLFIEPILSWSGNAIMWFGANVYDGVTNSIYRSAARGFREESSFASLIIILATLAGLFSAILMVMLLPRRRKPAQVESKRNYRKILFSALTVLFLLDGLVIVAEDFANIQLNTTFNQRITVLAAKVPEQRIRELKASWALMEKRADYEALTAEMNKLAKQFNTKLPAALPGAQ
jgi:hypothetical protein